MEQKKHQYAAVPGYTPDSLMIMEADTGKMIGPLPISGKVISVTNAGNVAFVVTECSSSRTGTRRMMYTMPGGSCGPF